MRALRRVVRELFEERLHDCVQASSTDVLGAPVRFGGVSGQRFDGVRLEHHVDALGRHQGLVLLGERILRLGEDLDEVVLFERVELDSDREATLQLGDEVRDLRDVEGTSRNEQDVVGLHRAVLRAHRGAFDDGKKVTLHPFPRYVRPPVTAVGRNLVDLVQEHDARLLGALHRIAVDLVVVDELLRLLLLEELQGIGDLEPTSLRPPLEARHLRHHVLEVHLLGTLRTEDSHERVVRVGDVELDLGVVESPVSKLLPNVVELAVRVESLRLLRLLRVDLEAQGAELMGLRVLLRLRRLRGRPLRREHHLREKLLGGILGARLHALECFLLADLNRVLDQVADHRLDVAPNIPNLGELGSLDLHEGRARQLSEPSSDFRLPDARGPDHDDVPGRDFLTKVALDVLSAPAIAKCDSDGALGLVLPDDVAVELADGLTWCEVP